MDPPYQQCTSAYPKGTKAWLQPAAIKGLVLFVVLAASLGVVYLSPLRNQLKHVHAMREMILSTISKRTYEVSCNLPYFH